MRLRRFAASLLSIIVCFLVPPGVLNASDATDMRNSRPPVLASFSMVMNRPKETPYYHWVQMIYTEVFRRLNIELTLVYSPLKRASVEANEGRVDGEPLRIYGYGQSFPNLIRVDEFVVPMRVLAYTSNDSVLSLNGWDSLVGQGYSVAYPRGMKICENNLSKRIPGGKLSDVTETQQGLRRLAKRRIDVYIDDLNSVAPILRKEGKSFANAIRVAGSMEEVKLYMYIHKKHKHLASKLSEVIQNIKTEGLIEQYRKTAFKLD